MLSILSRVVVSCPGLTNEVVNTLWLMNQQRVPSGTTAGHAQDRSCILMLLLMVCFEILAGPGCVKYLRSKAFIIPGKLADGQSWCLDSHDFAEP
jgi:hypothetical protein